jgi:hypothetical protein
MPALDSGCPLWYSHAPPQRNQRARGIAPVRFRCSPRYRAPALPGATGSCWLSPQAAPGAPADRPSANPYP